VPAEIPLDPIFDDQPLKEEGVSKDFPKKILRTPQCLA